MLIKIIIIILFVIILSVLLIAFESESNCEHEWEIIRQEIYYLSYRRVYECKKCGKKKYIEEWS